MKEQDNIPTSDSHPDDEDLDLTKVSVDELDVLLAGVAVDDEVTVTDGEFK